MPPSSNRRVSPKLLSECVAKVFVAHGLREADAAVVADSLVEADLRGVYSHGVMRVPTYVRGIEAGTIKAQPDVRVLVDEGARGLVDGDHGMGQIGADRAMKLAIQKAGEFGVGCVGLRHSQHCGAMAYWVMEALPFDLIGFATTNAGMNMAPTGGKDKIVGNNPFAVAAPTNRDWAMVLDMATSVVAGGKLDVARVRGEKIPLGWALDAAGQPTDDPAIARQGLLLPVGGPKGYGMAVMLDVLAGVLTGARFGGMLGPKGFGQFFMAIKVDGFSTVAEFKERMDELIDQIHNSALAAGSEHIFVPGEIEHNLAAERRRTGVPIDQPVLDEIDRLAAAKDIADRPSAW